MSSLLQTLLMKLINYQYLFNMFSMTVNAFWAMFLIILAGVQGYFTGYWKCKNDLIRKK